MAIATLRLHSRSLSWPPESNPAFSKLEESLSKMRGSKTSCSSLLLINDRRKDLNSIRCYLISGRKSKKTIQKSLKGLIRSSKSTHSIIAPLEKDNETTILVHMLKESEIVSMVTFEFLLAYLGGTIKAQSSGWSLALSKMIMSSKKNLPSSDQNEFEKIDDFFSQMTSFEDVHVEAIMSRLKGMDSTIQVLEEELDCLFRQLIKTRVYLLNMINH